jgi:hypothetical protein
MTPARVPVICVAAFALLAVNRPADIPFEKYTLDLGANETCAIADLNGDKRPDIVSGENWFENPGTVGGTWKRHRFRDLNFSNNYVDAFSDLILDVNADGRPDIVTATWFGRKISWWANPSKAGAAWKETIVDQGSPTEFAFLVDIDNDGKANELLPQFGNEKTPLAWFEAKDGTFRKHVISPQSYGHGIGAGDVNGDGRTDVLTPKGWLQAPADPRSGNWKMHAGFPQGTQLGFMHVIDVNKDGRNDVLTSFAHDYGVFWFEQGADGGWTKRVIDESWSQAHALSLVDLNGDGRRDILTGKRYMAHNGRDPGEREPLGIYWYQGIDNPETKRMEWVRHVIDYGTRTGAGMQIPVADLDGDGDLDFAVGGKSGAFVFENKTKNRTAAAKR